MPTFEEAFGVRAGHSVRLVGTVLRGRIRVWEHEEYDAHGTLVAVYEGWSCEPSQTNRKQDCGLCGFVKYSPSGWVLQRFDARAGVRNADGEAFSAMLQPPSMRWAMQG